MGFTAALVVGVLLTFAAATRAQHVDVRVHDPVMIEQDGTYYLFSTGRGVAVWTSNDMRAWERRDPVFEEAPAWTDRVVPDFRNHIWAPDVAFHDGTYYLYYSVSSFGKNTSAIGVATNTTLDPSDPAYEWVDRGPVVRSVPGRDMWNAIDPNLAFDEEGTPWLAFGSFWRGLKLVRMNDNLTELAHPQEWHTVAARHRYWKLDERDAGDALNGAIEAPFIFKKDGYYYLFVSWDRCCRGEESTYKIVVGRSRDITGPYVDRLGQKMVHGGGSLVVKGIEGSERWAAFGHNSAYTFDGTDYLVFHAYDVTDEGRSKLIVREIEWDDEGWPVVSLDA